MSEFDLSSTEEAAYKAGFLDGLRAYELHPKNPTTLTDLRELRKKATQEPAGENKEVLEARYLRELANYFDLPSTQAMLEKGESNARDAEDAKRYRWLRDTAPWNRSVQVVRSMDVGDDVALLGQEGLDIAIDAARRAEGRNMRHCVTPAVCIWPQCDCIEDMTSPPSHEPAGETNAAPQAVKLSSAKETSTEPAGAAPSSDLCGRLEADSDAGQTPKTSAQFAKLEGLDTRSVNAFWFHETRVLMCSMECDGIKAERRVEELEGLLREALAGLEEFAMKGAMKGSRKDLLARIAAIRKELKP